MHTEKEKHGGNSRVRPGDNCAGVTDWELSRRLWAGPVLLVERTACAEGVVE